MCEKSYSDREQQVTVISISQAPSLGSTRYILNLCILRENFICYTINYTIKYKKKYIIWKLRKTHIV